MGKPTDHVELTKEMLALLEPGVRELVDKGDSTDAEFRNILLHSIAVSMRRIANALETHNGEQ